MNQGWMTVLRATCAVLLVVSCSGQGDDSRGRQPSQFAQTILDSSPFQRALLSDGELSQEEYEASVLATVGCLKEHGVEIAVAPYPAPGHRIAFEFVGGVTEEEKAHANAIYQACYREFQETVDLVWSAQNAPDERTLELARGALARCLRAEGYLDLPDNPQHEDFKQARGHPAFLPCQQRVSQEFDLPGFGG